MKFYRILKDLVLSFNCLGDQRDYLLGPSDPGHLECNGATIWYVEGDTMNESITTANLIGYALEQGKIEEMTSPHVMAGLEKS